MNHFDSNTSKNGNGNKDLFESDRKLRTLVGNLPNLLNPISELINISAFGIDMVHLCN